MCGFEPSLRLDLVLDYKEARIGVVKYHYAILLEALLVLAGIASITSTSAANTWQNIS